MSPSEIIALGSRCGLKSIALTDHDTVKGLPEAIDAGKLSGIHVIPGIELSLGFHNEEIHLLGYGMDYTSQKFLDFVRQVQKIRDNRNFHILARMKEFGLDTEPEDIQAIAKGEFPGRPHFALYLVQIKLVKSVREAFDKYLGTDRPFYCPRDYIAVEEGTQAINEAGGIPVIAHPLSLMISRARLSNYLLEWKGLGVKGIEGYYSLHSPGKCTRLVIEAENLGFLVTGGSDFHGRLKPGIKLGRTCGNRRLTPEMVKPFLMEMKYCPIM